MMLPPTNGTSRPRGAQVTWPLVARDMESGPQRVRVTVCAVVGKFEFERVGLRLAGKAARLLRDILGAWHGESCQEVGG
jgi:hypothetical protein